MEIARNNPSYGFGYGRKLYRIEQARAAVASLDLVLVESEEAMTREEAIGIINSLHGLNEEDVMQAVSALRTDALTDAALIRIAEKQNEAEQAEGRRLDKVARYQDTHPGVSWQMAEEFVKHGFK